MINVNNSLFVSHDDDDEFINDIADALSDMV